MPLHIAAAYLGGEVGVAVVCVLMQAGPQALRLANKEGCLPLHVATWSQGGAEKGTTMSEAPVGRWRQADPMGGQPCLARDRPTSGRGEEHHRGGEGDFEGLSAGGQRCRLPGLAAIARGGHAAPRGSRSRAAAAAAVRQCWGRAGGGRGPCCRCT